MPWRNLNLPSRSALTDFHLYLHIIVSSLMLSGVLLSTIAITYGELFYTELALKISLIALSILVLIEIVYKGGNSLLLCTLIATLMLLNYYIIIAITHRVLIAIILTHTAQLLLWANLKNTFSTTSSQILYLYTWSTLYTTISTYSKLLLLQYFAKTLLVVIIATLMTPLILVGSRVLRKTTVKIESLLDVIVTRVTSTVVRQVKILTALFTSKTKILLEKASATKLEKSTQKILFKPELFTKRLLESSSKIDVEILTIQDLEALLNRFISFYRVLEDKALESMRVKVVKIVERLHHVFEYSLTILPLILGLLILLAMIIYVLTMP